MWYLAALNLGRVISKTYNRVCTASLLGTQSEMNNVVKKPICLLVVIESLVKTLEIGVLMT